MDAAIARDIARHSHDGQETRQGSPMGDHVERAALDLLTRRDRETFERHTLRIGDGEGPAEAIARRVKFADSKTTSV